jgi:hypothetical protein
MPLVNSQERLALVIHELPVDATNLTTGEGGKDMKTAIARFSTGILLTVISVLGLGWFSPAQADCQKQPIGSAQETVTGEGFVCPGPGGVSARLEALGLTPGNAYTLWFIYVPDGATCAADEATCFGANSTGGDQSAVPAEAFGRLSDVVAPKNGKATVSGDVPGFQPSTGSQVWLLLNGHGPLNTNDNLARARQLLTPEDPTVGAPNLGVLSLPAADHAALTIFSF